MNTQQSVSVVNMLGEDKLTKQLADSWNLQRHVDKLDHLNRWEDTSDETRHFHTCVTARLMVPECSKETNSDFIAATAYFILLTFAEGKYWEEETVDWAKSLIKGEKRVGAQIVREAIAKVTGK